MKKCFMLVALLAVLCGLSLLRPSRGQDAPELPAKAANGQQYYLQAQPPMSALPAYPQPAYSHRVSATQSEIGRLMKQLRETEDTAKKAELTKQLEGAVSKHFDEDLKARQAELTKLEERLKKLRAQLERRTKAKAEIIELQIKVLVNEAEGLGFSGASPLGYGVPDPNSFRLAPVAIPPSTTPRSP